MRILSYNILFGMKGNTVHDAAASHLSMHFLRPFLPFSLPHTIRTKAVKRRSIHMDEVLRTIEASNPDIMCLCEVLRGLHEPSLIPALSKMGYRSFHWGKGAKYAPPLDINVLLASKYEATSIDFSFPQLAKAGGGGGSGALYIPELDTVYIGVHLALLPNLRATQWIRLVEFVEQYRTKGSRIIVTGDFNCSADEVGQSGIAKYLSLVPLPEATFPSYSFPKILKRKIDHMLLDQTFSVDAARCERGYSDHLIVACDLQFQDHTI
jgi:hypothetical protein